MLKSIFTLIAALTLSLSSTYGQTGQSSDLKPYTAACPGELFGLEFVQNGGTICPQDGIVRLAKSEFKLRFFLPPGKVVYVNFSAAPALYGAVVAGEPIEPILWFGGTGMAEYARNPDRQIVLSDRAWHVWPAPEGPDDEFNRFDKTTPYSNGILCERTVRSVFAAAADGPLAISDLSTIYLVYCDVEYTGSEYVLHSVQAVKIIFE
jgi:hypothetical protein